MDSAPDPAALDNPDRFLFHGLTGTAARRAMYQERSYREHMRAEGLVASEVCRDESDLLILAPGDVRDAALDLLLEARCDLEAYIRRDERFRTTLAPHRPTFDAPLLAYRMAEAGERWGVGPMAAVAGAIAECIGEQLALKVGQVIVENGGDIFVQGREQLTCALDAGPASPFGSRLRFRLNPKGARLGVCTSSGTHGHSLSFGQADALCVVARDAAEADAAATALGNRVQSEDDIDAVLTWAERSGSLLGVLAAKGNRLGVWGEVEIVAS